MDISPPLPPTNVFDFERLTCGALLAYNNNIQRESTDMFETISFYYVSFLILCIHISYQKVRDFVVPSAKIPNLPNRILLLRIMYCTYNFLFSFSFHRVLVLG